MSLTGNLEDLPLLDIIQIVSFSKKTGYLTIRADPGDCAIVFSEGSIVAAAAWDSPPLDPRAATLAPAQRSELIRRRIELALEQLIRLREGQFNFALTEEVPSLAGERDLSAETLEHGINAQEVLLDLARGMDEDRRDSSAALEASFAEPPEVAAAETPGEPVGPEGEPAEAGPAPAAERPGPGPAPGAPLAAPEAPVPEAALRDVLLVDDEPDVRQVLAERFRKGGFAVLEAEDPDSAVKAAGTLSRGGTRFVLVSDLGMPTSGGSSFQGGFEVVKRLWKMGLRPPVLMMTDSLSPALQARARQMGIAGWVFKPGLSRLDPQQFQADMRAFAGKILTDVLPRLAHTGHAPEGSPAEKPKPAAKQGKPAAQRRGGHGSGTELPPGELALLQPHLDALKATSEPTQISMLVMKVARAHFERGILFLIKNEEVRGLGGYGRAPREQSLNLLVREITIPLSEPSLFYDVVGSRKPWSGPLPDGRLMSQFFERIGRFKASSIAVFPLLTHREVIALLYGDNPETGHVPERLDALELFVNQAGVAFEKAFLQRKLQTAAKA